MHSPRSNLNSQIAATCQTQLLTPNPARVHNVGTCYRTAIVTLTVCHDQGVAFQECALIETYQIVMKELSIAIASHKSSSSAEVT